ncbi:MAG: ChbG/HpnK family deacetylase [Proteobacteria bacterium]|nr:ChbG/HpnK family deacetylase [Pseudomonadota bacterium]
MGPNPVLKKLGLAETDRVAVFHADDIGMCQASVSAYGDLVDFGLISAASIMVPCPWFPAAADFCRQADHDRLDMGVHLTLTSEWQESRWRPLSTCDPASGMTDEAGFFHAETEAVRKQADPNAVGKEIRAQVECALAAGIDVTHIDSHMGGLFHPKFSQDYVELGFQNRVPAFLLRRDEAGLRELGVGSETAKALATQTRELEERGFPMLDHVYLLPLGPDDVTLEQARKALDDLPPGITYFIIHPSKDTPELRALASDWPSRVAHYRLFTDEALRKHVETSGIQVIGYRALRDLMIDG